MPRRTTLREDYFSWLYSLIKNPKNKRTYVKLCKGLHKIPFRWHIKNDDNRREDGLNLRDRYYEENRLDESFVEVAYWLREECSVLEMMIALAQRINGITYDLKDQEDKTPRWFLEMLKNLKLSRFTDNSTPYEELDPVQEAEVCDTLCDTLDRTYDRYGNGSFFPLKRRHPQDMRTTEIWYQLMLWLDENYGL